MIPIRTPVINNFPILAKIEKKKEKKARKGISYTKSNPTIINELRTYNLFLYSELHKRE